MIKFKVNGQEDYQVECYMEVFPVPPRLIVAGAGHVSEPVAAIGKMTGFHVTVIDDRPEFANKERFPTVDEVVCGRMSTSLRPFI